MKSSRRRIHRSRFFYRRGTAGTEQAPAEIQIARAEYQKDQIVLHVHVHNGAAPPAEPAGRPRRKTGSNVMGDRRPLFSGPLFGWKEHYDPIAQRMGPVVAEEQNRRQRRRLGRLSRAGLIVALLAAAVAVGCQVL